MTTKTTPIITLTPAAYSHIQAFLKPLGQLSGFRVGVKKSGCSGFSYTLDVGKPQPQDICFMQDQISIFVPEDSVSVLQGTELDLQEKEAGQKQLVFNNPNVVDSCGCGESFTVKTDEK